MAYDPEYQREYRKRPEVKARKKAWRQANPEKENARKRRWREKNRERAAEHRRKWDAENPEWKREWYLANRERILAQRREYQKQNREKIRAYQRAWYERNRETLLERSRAWAAAHPDKVRTYSSQRRAREAAVPAEQIDFVAVFERDEGICGICGGPVEPDDWHLDHIVPLAKGGHHLYENVQVAHPACNLRKGTQLAA